MALRKRAPGLLCLLLLTAAAVILAGRPTSDALSPPLEEQDPVQILEEDTVHYEDQPTVQLIPLSDLTAVDTDPEQVLLGEWAGLQTAEASEMAEVLSQLYLQDGTCIRLYVTAESLVYGAFLRPGGQWTRFCRLYGGEGSTTAFVQNLSLTSFSGILGKDGFLVRRTAHSLREHVYDYYWFDVSGNLQMLRAQFDPVVLDLNGDGTTELIWELAQWRSATTIYCQASDGVIYQVHPNTYGGSSLLTVEREGPGPARLIYRCEEDGRETFCAVTMEDDQLRIERNIVYVPAQTAAVPLPADPTEKMGLPVRLSVTGPDEQGVENAGDMAAWEFQSMLWEGDGVHTQGAVLVPTDAPLNEAAAYTVTFTSENGDALSWTLDDQGVCRLTGLEGTYRMISTGLGSLPEWCWATMALYCNGGGTFFS